MGRSPAAAGVSRLSLADEIATDSRRHGAGCSVCDFIEERPAAERAEWDQVMALPLQKAGHRATYEAMVRRGYKFQSENPVINHRQRRHRRDDA